MSTEINLEETRQALDAHKQLWLGGRVARRLFGKYPSGVARRALALHEYENRPPHEKIRHSIKQTESSIYRHNSTRNVYYFGSGKIPTASKVDETIIATDALPFTYPPARKLITALCVAGGRPELPTQRGLSIQGFYMPKGDFNPDEAFGIYLADKDMQRVEKVPFSVVSCEAMPAELQRELIDEALGYAQAATSRVMQNPLNLI